MRGDSGTRSDKIRRLTAEGAEEKQRRIRVGSSGFPSLSAPSAVNLLPVPKGAGRSTSEEIRGRRPRPDFTRFGRLVSWSQGASQDIHPFRGRDIIMPSAITPLLLVLVSGSPDAGTIDLSRA